MKKKCFTGILVWAIAVSVIGGCSIQSGNEPTAITGTEITSQAENSEQEEYQFVSPNDTLKAGKEGSTHILDVREWSNYSSGRVADSKWCPIFPLEEESLADQMKAYAEENLKDGKSIYIICYSGQRGAQKTTNVLESAGIDPGLIYTVEGGAKALEKVQGALTTNRADEKIDWQYINAAELLGIEDGQVVDVRDGDSYAEGHLENSLQVDLKEFESAEAHTALYQLAEEKLQKDKPVYFLCYSGNKCAKTAISVLKDAGFEEKKLFIIEDGAKDRAIEAAFVK